MPDDVELRRVDEKSILDVLNGYLIVHARQDGTFEIRGAERAAKAIVMISAADDVELGHVDDDPWHPIKDPVDLKHLGKLVEELGELVSATARVIIQQIDACHPETGKPNRLWLQEEIADVRANMNLVIDRFKLNHSEMNARENRKRERLKKWHNKA